jgi:hypothetical protein
VTGVGEFWGGYFSADIYNGTDKIIYSLSFVIGYKETGKKDLSASRLYNVKAENGHTPKTEKS